MVVELVHFSLLYVLNSTFHWPLSSELLATVSTPSPCSLSQHPHADSSDPSPFSWVFFNLYLSSSVVTTGSTDYILQHVFNMSLWPHVECFTEWAGLEREMSADVNPFVCVYCVLPLCCMTCLAPFPVFHPLIYWDRSNILATLKELSISFYVPILGAFPPFFLLLSGRRGNHKWPTSRKATKQTKCHPFAFLSSLW